VGFRIPVWLRRLVTMVPAFIVVALGVNATEALVVSQVVLSLTLPFPMIALVIFTGRSDIMGAHVMAKPMVAVAVLAAFVVIALNGVLLWQSFGMPVPFLTGAG